MTIGIAAAGPRAGQAVFEALRAVEQVASGAIRGFASFVAITADGQMVRAETQRGGTRTLFTDAETTGTAPPETVADAVLAGVISSGPDRPMPLCQFLPAEPAVGLITGHRLPNRAGVGGSALNLEVLAHLRAGLDPKAAIDAVLDANPRADAGLIAADRHGRIHARNSERVAERPDLGHARRAAADGGAVVEVLHNAILPVGPLAALAADVAMETMRPMWRADGWIVVEAGTEVALGDVPRVLVDADMVARRIVTLDSDLLEGRRNGAAIYLHALVEQGGRILGRTIAEPNVSVKDRRIVSMSGQTRLRLPFQAIV